MRHIIAALALIVMLAGCTVSQSAKYAVERYCAQPEETRAAYRAALAQQLAPNRLEIHCVSDQP